MYWLNTNLKLLSHDIKYAVSSIPGVNKYFLLLLIYILIHYVGRLGCQAVRVSCDSNLFTLYSMIDTVNIYHQDLSCEYIEMKFRIYLLGSNISCIYSTIKF